MKISDKLVKINDSYNVYMYDNGYMFEASGMAVDQNYAYVKIMCLTLDDLQKLIAEASTLPRNS